MFNHLSNLPLPSRFLLLLLRPRPVSLRTLHRLPLRPARPRMSVLPCFVLPLLLPLPLVLSNAHLRQVLSFPQCSQRLPRLHLRCGIISLEQLIRRRMPPSSSPPAQELHRKSVAFLVLPFDTIPSLRLVCLLLPLSLPRLSKFRFCRLRLPFPLMMIHRRLIDLLLPPCQSLSPLRLPRLLLFALPWLLHLPWLVHPLRLLQALFPDCWVEVVPPLSLPLQLHRQALPSPSMCLSSAIS
jgi:hypothetical protein